MKFSDCPYQSYYHQQAGGGVGAIYRGAPYQKGHGIGSFLGGLFRSVLPLLKSGARAVGKETLKTGVNILEDIANDQSLKEAFRNRVNEASKNLTRKALDKLSLMEGKGLYKRKRMIKEQSVPSVKRQRSKGRANKRKKLVENTDIFSAVKPKKLN